MAHAAMQPLAKAARANIPAEDDASHTNLTWNEENSAFLSNPMASIDGDIAVGLVGADLSLVVARGGEIFDTLGLSGVSVNDADGWLDSRLTTLGLKPASPIIHPYDLPSAVEELEAYSVDGMQKELATLSSWFALADRVLRQFVAENGDLRPGPSPVRCWPHHYDIATYVSLEIGDSESTRGIGVGMSPGDESYEEPYFYVNPWPHLDANDLPDLSGPGHWHREGFVGAIMTASELLSADDLVEGANEFVAQAFAIGRDRLGF